MAEPRATERVGFLSTRLGRRLFATFVLCALGPILALAGLSWSRVGSELQDQSRRRLHQAARASGMRVIEKLDAVEHELRALAEEGYTEARAARLTGTVSALTRFGSDGTRIETAAYTGTAPPPDPDESRWLAEGKPALRAARGPAGPEVVLLVPTPLGSMAAEVAPAYLFDHSPANVLPVEGELFVVDGEGRSLFSTFAGVVPPSAPTRRQGEPLFEGWRVAGRSHLGVRWTLFLRPRFGIDSWVVAVSEPEELALAAASTFRAVLGPVVFSTLVVVSLLSGVLIRRRLVPLRRLTEGTRRVAEGDFAPDLGEPADDELGELAIAFTAMAERLAGQFHSMERLIEIDRRILACSTPDEIVDAALISVESLYPAPCMAIVRPAEEGSEVTVLTQEGPPRREVFGQAAFESGLASDPYGVLELESLPGFLRSLAPPGLDCVLEFPLRAGAVSRGCLMVWLESRSDVDGTRCLYLRELCNQLASALVGVGLREENERLLHFDSRTGLPNRTGLLGLLEERISTGGSGLVAVGEISLVGLGRFRRTFGADAAHRLLLRLASAISADTDISAAYPREGAFAALVSGQDLEDVARRLRKVPRVLRRALAEIDDAHSLDLAQGVAVHPLDGEDAATVLRKAEEACLHAAEAGTGGTTFYSFELTEHARARAGLESDLRRAASRGELRLHYQPIVDAHSVEVVAAEALIRWQHPEHGLLAPDRFIPIAEECGLVSEIGDWALLRACEDIRAWSDHGLPGVRISVNVSPQQLAAQTLLSRVHNAISRTGISGASLCLELTESAFVAMDPATAETLDALRRMGIAAAIDDFGTGYSSLSYLKRLPVDLVKLDRSFLEGVPGDEAASALLQGIITLSQQLGLGVVVEGCESEEQLALLQQAGCDEVQGFLFARPMPEDSFRELLSGKVQVRDA